MINSICHCTVPAQRQPFSEDHAKSAFGVLTDKKGHLSSLCVRPPVTNAVMFYASFYKVESSRHKSRIRQLLCKEATNFLLQPLCNFKFQENKRLHKFNSIQDTLERPYLSIWIRSLKRREQPVMNVDDIFPVGPQKCG